MIPDKERWTEEREHWQALADQGDGKPMTAGELANILIDDFHDWTDGEDWPVQFTRTDITSVPYIAVQFASGRRLIVQIYDLDGLGVPHDTSKRV